MDENPSDPPSWSKGFLNVLRSNAQLGTDNSSSTQQGNTVGNSNEPKTIQHQTTAQAGRRIAASSHGGNNNRNQRRSTVSQTSHQLGANGNNHPNANVAKGRRNSSSDFQGKGRVNPNYHERQQFRNNGASSQQERRPNAGQFNGNRNQRSENHERNQGQNMGNGNFQRRRRENQPT